MGVQNKISVKEKPDSNEVIIDNRYSIYTDKRFLKTRFISGEVKTGMRIAPDPRDVMSYFQIETSDTSNIEGGYIRPNRKPRIYLVAKGYHETKLLVKALEFALEAMKEKLAVYEKGVKDTADKKKASAATGSNQNEQENDMARPKPKFDYPCVTADGETLLCPKCHRPLEVRENRYGIIYGCTGFRNKIKGKCEYLFDKQKADKLDRNTLEVAEPAGMMISDDD